MRLTNPCLLITSESAPIVVKRSRIAYLSNDQDCHERFEETTACGPRDGSRRGDLVELGPLKRGRYWEVELTVREEGGNLDLLLLLERLAIESGMKL